MRVLILGALVVFGALLAAVEAQSTGGDEAAIRVAIAEVQRTDLRTVDSIFFSGILKRPFVRGQSEPEPTTRGQTVVPGSDRVEVRVRRIEIAQAGDMAYEFSDGTVNRRVRTADGREEPATVENSILRVWRKVDGRWLIAAHFSAPHGDRR